MKIIILMGLPGSGKTTFAKQFKKEHNNTYIIDSDQVRLKDTDTKINWIIRHINSVKHQSVVIVDGLFLTNNIIADIIVGINNSIKHQLLEFEIDYWREDRASCLYNDVGRRSVNAEKTIKNAKFEKPQSDYLLQIAGSNVSIVLHDVLRKPSYKALAESNGFCVKDNLYIYSDSWAVNGKIWDDYGNCVSTSPEEQPDSFDDFDNLLEKICPTITFLQYKKIYKQCVSIEEREVHDYYSSDTERYFRCNLKILYELLYDMNLLNKEY